MDKRSALPFFIPKRVFDPGLILRKASEEAQLIRHICLQICIIASGPEGGYHGKKRVLPLLPRDFRVIDHADHIILIL